MTVLWCICWFAVVRFVVWTDLPERNLADIFTPLLPDMPLYTPTPEMADISDAIC